MMLKTAKTFEYKEVNRKMLSQLFSGLKRAKEEIGRLVEFSNRIIESTPAALAVLKGKERIVASVNPAYDRDISERKRVEEELQESEERYRDLYEHAPVMMHSIDSEGSLVSVNDYWLESLGYRRSEVIGRQSTEFLTEASRRYAVDVALPEFWETGIARDVEYQMVKKNDEVIDVLLSGILQKDKFGEIEYTRAFIVEVTERKRAEEALRQSEARVRLQAEELILANIGLTKANEATTVFLATMSHEMRTPLNAVIGFSEVLQDQTFGELNQHQARYVNNVLISGRHLLVLINDVLELSRIEAGGLELALSQLDVREALAEAMEAVRLISAEKQIEMTSEVESGLPAITADESKFKQVVYNLVGNAIKFTPEGGRINVVASSAQGGLAGPSQAVPEIQISVSDTGIGIKLEDQQRIFEPFEQVDSSSTREGGAGLGLTLTRRLVELHGGRIWVESEGIEGKGSTFTFVLPVNPPEGAESNLDQSGSAGTQALDVNN